MIALSFLSFAAIAQAEEATFTVDECKQIALIASKVVTAVGRDTLTTDFLQSFRNWLGADISCDGPMPVHLITGADIAAYNTMRAVLGSGDHPIHLKERGVLVD